VDLDHLEGREEKDWNEMVGEELIEHDVVGE
jgi:hypothetical protein